MCVCVYVCGWWKVSFAANLCTRSCIKTAQTWKEKMEINWINFHNPFLIPGLSSSLLSSLTYFHIAHSFSFIYSLLYANAIKWERRTFFFLSEQSFWIYDNGNCFSYYKWKLLFLNRSFLVFNKWMGTCHKFDAEIKFDLKIYKILCYSINFFIKTFKIKISSRKFKN